MTQKANVIGILTAVFNEGMAYQIASLKEFKDMEFLSVHEAEQAINQYILDEKKKSWAEGWNHRNEAPYSPDQRAKLKENQSE
jgi:hypothetical protein